MANEVVIRNEIDLLKLVSEAEAAGFNPLTVLRNGGAAGYAVQRQPLVLSGGSFTSMPDPEAPVLPPVVNTPVVQEAQPMTAWRSFLEQMVPGGGNTGDASPGEWEMASEYAMARAQAAMGGKGATASKSNARPAGTYTLSAPAVTASNKVVAVPVGGARPASSPSKAPLKKDKSGFQPEQIYDDDKIPSVIESDTSHWLLPGVTWEEVGGTSRGETWEVLYGDDNPLSWMMVLPKFGNDVLHNLQRLNKWPDYVVQTQVLPAWDKAMADRWVEPDTPVFAPGVFK